MMLLRMPDTYWTVQEELCLFGGAVLCGIPCGILLDILRVLRRWIAHPRAVVAIEDVLWMLGCAVVLLCYASAFGAGVFRGYYLVGCAAGLGIYVCTVGRIVVGLAEMAARPVRKGTVWLCRKVKRRSVKIHQKRGAGKEIAQNVLQGD